MGGAGPGPLQKVGAAQHAARSEGEALPPGTLRDGRVWELRAPSPGGLALTEVWLEDLSSWECQRKGRLDGKQEKKKKCGVSVRNCIPLKK